MRIEVCLGGGIDDRADLNLRIARIADHKFARRPGDHRDHLVRDILLDAKKPERGAALPGRAKCRGEDIVANLFGQGRRIDDHRVDPASLRDQHGNWPVLGGQPAIDFCGGFHRAGESHPRHSGQGDKLLRQARRPPARDAMPSPARLRGGAARWPWRRSRASARRVWRGRCFQRQAPRLPGRERSTRESSKG